MIDSSERMYILGINICALSQMQAMEVWRRTFVLAAVLQLVTMAIIAPPDSAVINSKQLFEARTRAKRQAVQCDIPEQTANPCLQNDLNQFRFPCANRHDTFIQCQMGNAMSFGTCPEEVPYFDPKLLTCTPAPAEVLQCHLSANPCTNHNINVLGIYRFSCPSNRHAYLACDHEDVGLVQLVHCSSQTVFSQARQRCVTTTTQPPVHTTAHSSSVTEEFSAACSQEAIQSGVLYLPYNPDPQKYIACDEWGGFSIRSCAPDYYFNAVSHICTRAFVGRK